MSQEQDFQEIEEEYEAEENAKHDMRMRRMGEMPVGRLILTMSWPAMIAMLIQAFYNIVDSFFVSMISEQALAAVTYVFPIQMLLISIAIGTGVGINSLISRRLGAKLYEEADMAANHGYRLSFFNWMFFALIGIFLTSPFMNLMSDTPFIVESGSSYMRIITIGSLFCIVQMTSEKILQATGNMIVPMICGIIGGVSNIILDPLFIFGIGPFPELGVAGAGVATIGGQFLSMCVGQIVLFKTRRKGPLVGLEIQGQDRPGYLCSRCTGDFNAVHRIYHAVRHEHHSGNTNGNSCCRYGCIRQTAVLYLYAGLRSEPGSSADHGFQLRR